MKLSRSTLRRVEAVVKFGRERRISRSDVAVARYLEQRGASGVRFKTKHRRAG